MLGDFAARGCAVLAATVAHEALRILFAHLIGIDVALRLLPMVIPESTIIIRLQLTFCGISSA